MSNPEVNVGVVGATGLVGGKILEILETREFPVNNMRLFATEKSAGVVLPWRDREITVEDVGRSDLNGMNIVLMSAGAKPSLQLAPTLASTGATVIDNSSAWRHHDDVPLVVSEVNPDDLNLIPKGIVANPNCTTMIAMVALKPLHDHASLRTMNAVTYQAADGAGQKGANELKNQRRWYVNKGIYKGEVLPVELAVPDVFPAQIFDNVISYRGKFQGEETVEEIKLREESRKILDIDDLKVSPSCGSVPVERGHGIDLKLGFEKPILPEQAKYFLEDKPGIFYEDLLDVKECVGRDEVLVGRLRPCETAINGLSIFVAGDNIRKGAALNAVQLAELVVQKHLS